jgi:hypothetical protein
VRKRPKKVSLLAELGHKFKYNQIGSRRVRIISSKNALSATDWLNMILIDWLWMFFQFWASLVVVAVMEINGKRKIFGWHWFLIYFANFWAYFIILAIAHFDF